MNRDNVASPSGCLDGRVSVFPYECHRFDLGLGRLKMFQKMAELLFLTDPTVALNDEARNYLICNYCVNNACYLKLKN